MKYEITRGTCAGRKAKKFAKDCKAKATRLANKRIANLHQKGLDDLADSVIQDPRKGWAD